MLHPLHEGGGPFSFEVRCCSKPGFPITRESWAALNHSQERDFTIVCLLGFFNPFITEAYSESDLKRKNESYQLSLFWQVIDCIGKAAP